MEITSVLNQKHPLKFSCEDGNPLKGILNGTPFSLRVVEKYDTKNYLIEQEGRKYAVRLLHIDTTSKTAVVKVDGTRFTIKQEDSFDLLLDSLGMSGGSSKKINEIKAPMPGVVLDVKVNLGDEVEEGDPLIILEAMKMENILHSPISGKIKGIEVTIADTVEKNKILLTFE